MALRKRAGSFVRSGKVRQTDWVLAVATTSVVNVPAASKVLLVSFPSATLATLAPSTLIRTRGIFSISSDQQAAGEQQLGAVGFGFVNEVARALGVTGLPGPFTDDLWGGWFYHQYIAQRFGFASGVGFEADFAPRTVIDSKAMRKFESDEGLVFMVENGHATHGFDIQLHARMLIKAG